MVRSFGGDEDHPTITHFGQIFRLLCLYTPLKMATKGNCSGEADSVLVAVNESLSEKKLDALSRKEAREDKLGKCISQTEFLEPAAEDKLQHSYSRSTAKENALHYLAGYVAKKARKSTNCADCLVTLVSTDHVPPAANLTETRSFVPGALQHPSDALTSMLNDIERVIEKRTAKKEVFGDLFWVVVDELSQNALVRVGCSAHFEELSARILKFYLVTRMHFYTKFLHQHENASIQVKAARKRAKLI